MLVIWEMNNQIIKKCWTSFQHNSSQERFVQGFRPWQGITGRDLLTAVTAAGSARSQVFWREGQKEFSARLN